MFADLFVRLSKASVGSTLAGEPSASYDRLHVLRLLYEEVHRTHVAMVRWMLGASHAERTPADARTGDARVLAATRRALLEHPIAAQAALRALAQEGRRYAETPEGQADWDRLRRSAWLPRARALWSELTLDVIEDHPDTVVPSMILDLLHALIHAPEHARERGP